MHLIVPEYHRLKEGEESPALHFHGLVSGSFAMADSGLKTKNGQAILNMQDWKYGFSTAVGLCGDYQNVCKYICKYVTKDTEKILGNRYYAGGDLVRKPEASYFDVSCDEYASFPADEVYNESAYAGFKYLDIDVCNQDDELVKSMVFSERLADYIAEKAMWERMYQEDFFTAFALQHNEWVGDFV